MPAGEAGQYLARRFGGTTRARQALAIGLREGVLTGAAESTAICQDDEDEFVEEHAGPRDLLAIPASLWTHSKHWEADLIRWDWEFGDFEIENLDTGCSYLLHGVHSVRAEIEEIDASLPPYSEIFHSRAAQNFSDQTEGTGDYARAEAIGSVDCVSSSSAQTGARWGTHYWTV